jgi:hypothetical protein
MFSSRFGDEPTWKRLYLSKFLWSSTSLIDVLDRVLDKGIVVDAWVRISLVGIDLITVEARVVVASIDTYLKYAEAVGLTPAVSRPALAAGAGELPEEETRRRVTVEVERERR